MLRFLPRIPLAYALLEHAETGLAYNDDSLEAALGLARKSA